MAKHKAGKFAKSKRFRDRALVEQSKTFGGSMEVPVLAPAKDGGRLIEVDRELLKKSPALAMTKMLMQGADIPLVPEVNLHRDKGSNQWAVKFDQPHEAGEDHLTFDINNEDFNRLAPLLSNKMPASDAQVIDNIAKLINTGHMPKVGGPIATALLDKAIKRAKELKGKRVPLLVDEFLHGNFLPHNKRERQHYLAMKANLMLAKKFVLDAQAARYAAEMIRDYPEAIALDQEFAIPCFPKLYIEMPYQTFFETLGGFHDSETGDTEVGYFIDGPTAYVMSRVRKVIDTIPPEYERDVRDPNTPMVMPICYNLNRPLSEAQQVERAKVFDLDAGEVGLDVLLWGSSSEKLAQHHPDLLSSLRKNHGFDVWYGHAVEKALPALFRSAAGDLRNIIALILFLNRTRDVQYEMEMPPHHGFIKAKPKTFVRHSIVRIKLDPKPMFRRIYGHTGIWRRRHDVRGHFCHDKKARGAEHHPDGHHWVEYKVNEWKCDLCHGLKWWRRACSRGSAEKGVVQTDYEVTK